MSANSANGLIIAGFKMNKESFTTVGHLIRNQGKNVIGEVVDEVFFFEGKNRHTLQKIGSETETFYIFQTYNVKKEHFTSVILNIFPEHLLSELLKKAREKGWNI